jgi:hypothetical protein
MKTFKSIEESNAYKKQLTDESVGITKLSILIATTIDRRMMFNMLMQEFHMQIEKGRFKGQGLEQWIVMQPRMENDQPVLDDKGIPIIDSWKQGFKHPDIVELVFEEDDKELSIGAKRQKLLERARGKYIVYFDSDDYPKPNYISKIMAALADGPDCIGFKIQMTTNGQKPETCIHSLRNPEWAFKNGEYLRNVTHFNPVKKDLALQVGFPDLRFGEDKVYSDAVSKLCEKEIFIDDFLFDYRYSTKEEHGKKYGYSK